MPEEPSLEKLFGLQMTTIAAALGACQVTVLLVLAFMAWRNNVMLKLGLRPIARRRTQSTLIVVGLMLATLIITAAFVTGDTLSHTIRSLVIEQLGPVDEVIRLRANGGSASGTSTYFNLSKYDDLAAQLADDPFIDATVPAIRQSVPVVNLTRRQSIRALAITGVQLEDAPQEVPLDERADTAGHPLFLGVQDGRQIYLNQSAADALQAQPGDRPNLYVGSTPKVFIVAGVSAGGRSPRATMDLHQAQALFGERGRINAILISNLGDQRQGVRYSQQVTSRPRGLLSDDFATRRLFQSLAGDASVVQALTSSAVGYDGNTRADLLSIASGLETGQLTEEIRSLLADEGIGQEVQTILEHTDWQTATLRRRLETQFNDLSDFSVDDQKRDGLDSAELAANAFTAIFVVTGLFGIASGLLLIFLIFVMLAAERKSEMGMTRAVGAQRKHLVQMFVYEGTAYDLGAAAVGVVLGVVTGLLIALTLGSAFASSDLAIRPNVTLTSLAVSYSLGMLVTFATVLFSALRVSRLNIVSAIRDLPEPPPRPVSIRARLLSPFTALVNGFRHLRHLRLVRAMRSWFLEIPSSIFGLIWASFRGGPLTFLLGLLRLTAGLGAQSGAMFTSGASFALIGFGLILR
jgi:ABC-type lipoprotein release transport system permease subunit